MHTTLPEEVGSAVISRVLNCAACEFGMIRMSITSQALPVTVCAEILRSLECCTTPLLVEKEDWLLECGDLYPF